MGFDENLLFFPMNATRDNSLHGGATMSPGWARTHPHLKYI